MQIIACLSKANSPVEYTSTAWTASFPSLESVWFRVRLRLLHDESRANDNEVTAVIVSDKVVVLLAHQSASSLVSRPAQRGSTRSRWVLFHIDEQRAGNVTFVAGLLSWFPIGLHR